VENSEKIIKWSLDNKNLLNLEVVYYTGLKDFLPKVEDIGINISINNLTFHGRGSDSIEEIAYLKALSECVERATTFFLEIPNTNGIAAHFDLSSAKKNARNELIERDAFLCNFLLNSNLKKIQTRLFPRLSTEKHIVIDYFEMAKNQMGVGVLAFTSSSKNFLSYGLAFASNVETSLEKSTTELLRDFVHFENKQNIQSISIEDFNNAKESNLNAHRYVSNTKEYLELFLKSITNENFTSSQPTYKEDDFSYKVISQQKLFHNCPLHVVQAINPKLQNLFTGPTTADKVNFTRLTEVAGRVIRENDLNFLPHPID
jgi:ribosomal protein S12 methylthiotransferase accessory factor YcaO